MNNNIIIPFCELKIISVVFFISCIFLFIGGYFFGKKQALEELAARYEDEYFADKIQQSLAVLYDQQDTSKEEHVMAESSEEEEVI